MESWFIYMAECSDGTIYVGVARDVLARIAAHDAGRGARYTRGRGPLRLLASRRCATHGDALRLERTLKNLPRKDKLALIASRVALTRFVSRARRAWAAREAYVDRSGRRGSKKKEGGDQRRGEEEKDDE